DRAGSWIPNVDGENTLTLCGAWQRREAGGLGVLTEAFVVAEEERAVFHDRTAADHAVLVPVERRLLSVRWFEIRAGVQSRVAEELPAVAMQSIGPAAIRDVHRGSRSAAVFGAGVVRDDAEFTDGVGRRLHHLIGESLIARAVGVIVDTVDQKV